MPRFRLTIYFVVIALAVMTVVTVVVNSVGSRLAEENLLRITEENTVRDAAHIQSMMRGVAHSMRGMGDSAAGSGMGMAKMPAPSAFTLESLAGPDGLSQMFPGLVEGLNVFRIDVMDLEGNTAWTSSTDSAGDQISQIDLYEAAADGANASRLLHHGDTPVHSAEHRHVVETYIPLLDAPGGTQIGVLGVHRDVTSDFAIQVVDTKRRILPITAGFTVAMFIIFTTFIAVADVLIFRARRREVSAIQQQLADREQARQELATQARELARSNGDLQQFAYVASHDLQEPLRMVTAYTQLLAKRYKGKLDSDADEFIGFAVDGATRMQELINDLLAYSRLDSQGKELQPVNVDEIVDGAVSNLSGAIDESQAIVTRDPLPTVDGDGLQLGQLYQNLVGNAIKYRGDRKPKVHVGAERRNGEWRLSVADNGIGIDPRHSERIFAIFQRLHTRDEYPGTGIGLGICKKIVERHGGRIWVESQPGEGSTFYFTIPHHGGNGA